MSYGLGIDLGASFVKAAIGRGGRAQMAALTEHSVLLPVGSSPASGPRTVLGEVLRIVTASEGGPPERVVLTHPAPWSPARLDQLRDDARDAGLPQFSLMPEPEAAASTFARRNRPARKGVVAVLDVGASSTKITTMVLRGSGVEMSGTPQALAGLGGDLFDRLLIAHVDRTLGGVGLDARPAPGAPGGDLLRRVHTDCTQAKERLSGADRTSIMILHPGRNSEIRLTRSEFEAMLQPHVGLVGDALRKRLRSTGIPPTELVGVLLAGGSSRIPLIHALITDELGLTVLSGADPQHANALGAAESAGAHIKVPVAPVAARPAPRRRPRVVLTSGRQRTLAAAAVVAVAATAGGIYVASAGSANGPAEAISNIFKDSGDAANPPRSLLPSASPTLSTATPAPTVAPTGPIAPATAAVPGTTGRPRAVATGRDGAGPGLPETQKTPAKAVVVKTTKAQASVQAADFEGRVTEAVGRCLDVEDGAGGRRLVVHLAQCNDTSAQHWIADGDGQVIALGKCLDGDMISTRDGSTPVIGLKACDSSSDQRWSTDGDLLINKTSGKCMTVPNASTADRIELILSKCRDLSNQRFILP